MRKQIKEGTEEENGKEFREKEMKKGKSETRRTKAKETEN